jgi:hypothetical protein
MPEPERVYPLNDNDDPIVKKSNNDPLEPILTLALKDSMLPTFPNCEIERPGVPATREMPCTEKREPPRA